MSRAVPQIIVLTNNTLSSIGLRGMLISILPFAAVRVCYSVEELKQNDPSSIFHIFVSSQILLENVATFEPFKHKTIALTMGSVNCAAMHGFHQINVQQREEDILASITAMHTTAHGASHSTGETSTQPSADLLSPREIEVAKLLVEGYINKEIASMLDISITTVITHRKNIFEKLGIKSIAGLTIYAIMKRYIEL